MGDDGVARLVYGDPAKGRLIALLALSDLAVSFDRLGQVRPINGAQTVRDRPCQGVVDHLLDVSGRMSGTH